jgi:hypothetical protein
MNNAPVIMEELFSIFASIIFAKRSSNGIKKRPKDRSRGGAEMK